MSRAALLRLPLAAILLTVLLGALPTARATSAADAPDTPSTTLPAPATTPRSPVPTFHVKVGIDGEVYPAIANFSSLQKPQDRRWATVLVTVTNPTDAPLQTRLTVRIPGWSDEEIQVAELAAGEVRSYDFAPTFLPRFYANHEIAAATAAITATDITGHVIFFQTTAPVRLRAAGDMYWGQDFQYAPFIASWVTPHDALVEKVLSRAKEFMPGRRLPGYEDWKNDAQQERSTREQTRAIYLALKRSGLSYVKSSLTFGENEDISERIRLPHESLKDVSANCIDGVVLFASLFENLAMDPVVVVVPGHAYVGVRVARNSDRYLYVDTSLTARVSFEAAVRAADRGLALFPASQITRVDISDARNAGIFPMP